MDLDGNALGVGGGRLLRQDQAPAGASSLPWANRINIKNDSRLEGLIKMADLVKNLAAICTPADYNTGPLDTIYSNFIGALPVVKYCAENNPQM